MDIKIGEDTFEVLHQFSEKRVIINYEDATVFANRNDDGTWDLSGDVASAEEKPIFDALVGPLNITIIKKTKV